MGTNGTFPLYIGASRIYGEYFDGNIDEVSIWNIALTQSQIQSGMLSPVNPSATGLIAYYDFDNGVAGGINTPDTILQHKTLYSFHGTLNNFALNSTTSN